MIQTVLSILICQSAERTVRMSMINEFDLITLSSMACVRVV